MLVPMLSLCSLSTLCDICLPFSQVFLQSGRLHPYLCHVADLSYPCSAEQGCLPLFACGVQLEIHDPCDLGRRALRLDTLDSL